MAFDLSFGPEFFLAEGEPYDRSDKAVNKDGDPISVWTAINSMDKDDWNSMCEAVFPGIDPEHVTPESVLEQIEKVDTCGTLTPPVDVWIDSEGYHRVDVYDGPEKDRDE